LGWFQVHVGLHIVSTEAALVKKILNAKACNALLIHPHAGNRGCPGRPQAKSREPGACHILLRFYGLGERDQIVRKHANDASPRAVDIGDE
jgi:hypothetical protein